MKAAGAMFAVNTTPCSASKHRIRTRAGHCAMCDTAKIGYMKRHEASGIVYLATSKKGHLVKVGMTERLAERVEQLNSYRYGGQSDWVLKKHKRCERAGYHESQIHKILASWRHDCEYYKDGTWQSCYEVFACSEAVAIDAFDKAFYAHK